MLFPLMCAGLLLTAAPAKKQPPKQASPALTEVKVGDYVEYELKTSKGGGFQSTGLGDQPVRLRLQAVEVTDEVVVVNVHALEPSPRRWLAPGLSFRLVKSGKPPEGPGMPGVIPVRDPSAKPAPFQEEKRGASTFRCRPYSFDYSRGDGPKGEGCADSPDPVLALGEGIVFSQRSSAGMSGFWSMSVSLLAAGHGPISATLSPLAYREGTWWTTFQQDGAWKKLVKHTVTSAAGKVVFKESRFDASEPGDQPVLAAEGVKWNEPIVSEYGVSVLSVMLDLLDSSELNPTIPKVLADGPPSSAGPRPAPTKQVEVAKAGKLTFYAQPELLLDAPLPVRFGYLERVEGDRSMKVIEWR